MKLVFVFVFVIVLVFVIARVLLVMNSRPFLATKYLIL